MCVTRVYVSMYLMRVYVSETCTHSLLSNSPPLSVGTSLLLLPSLHKEWVTRLPLVAHRVRSLAGGAHVCVCICLRLYVLLFFVIACPKRISPVSLLPFIHG